MMMTMNDDDDDDAINGIDDDDGDDDNDDDTCPGEGSCRIDFQIKEANDQDQHLSGSNS